MPDQIEKLTLSNIRPPKGATTARKRIGRGIGSGLGKTSGKGHKGHKARTGGSTNPGFEGGQMPLYRRLPKRGFTNPFKVTAQVVNLAQLSALDGTDVTPESLAAAGLIRQAGIPVKLLAQGEAERAYRVSGMACSAAAKAKVEAAGGQVEQP
jgi:large subunit ribosomal protein L15